MESHINVGYGSDVTIAELAKAVGMAVGYQGAIEFNADKPDGSPRKWMRSLLLNQLGWNSQIGLNEGLKRAYADFLKKYSSSESTELL
jgi:GDP-L-fucose synthase